MTKGRLEAFSDGVIAIIMNGLMIRAAIAIRNHCTADWSILRSYTNTGEWDLLDFLSQYSASHPGRTGVMSQIPSQFCHSEYKRSMAPKYVGQS
jgi:hypothetical protein